MKAAITATNIETEYVETLQTNCRQEQVEADGWHHSGVTRMFDQNARSARAKRRAEERVHGSLGSVTSKFTTRLATLAAIMEHFQRIGRQPVACGRSAASRKGKVVIFQHRPLHSSASRQNFQKTRVFRPNNFARCPHELHTRFRFRLMGRYLQAWSAVR